MSTNQWAREIDEALSAHDIDFDLDSMGDIHVVIAGRAIMRSYSWEHLDAQVQDYIASTLEDAPRWMTKSHYDYHTDPMMYQCPKQLCVRHFAVGEFTDYI